jgi:transposase
MPAAGSAVLRQLISELQEEILRSLQNYPMEGNFRNRLSWFRSSLKAIRMVTRLKTILGCWQLPARHLRFVSEYALALVYHDFADQGITRDADSFRVEFEKSDLNSPSFQGSSDGSLTDPGYPFITPRQWQLIEPLLPPPDHTAGRGRPPADPRPLLDAAFWKFAHHARWQELPGIYPSMLTCRRYYRRLFLSGRLRTIYTAIYKDLLARSGTDLTVLVEQGCFSIENNRIILNATMDDMHETWQIRTALLFMQLGYQAYRHVDRLTKYLEKMGIPWNTARIGWLPAREPVQ